MKIMRKTRYLTLITVLLASSIPLYAAELETGKVYRLGITLTDLRAALGDKKEVEHIARKSSKFVVIETQDPSDYIVQFVKIKGEDKEDKIPNLVNRENLYKIKKEYQDPSLDITSVVSETLSGLSAGPLVVPFKYRLNDKSLTGDATVGFYAGITAEPFCRKSGQYCFRLTPLISAGISQVSVSNSTETAENKSAVTVAAGFLITGWSDLNIGFIYGQDRIGDQSWEHEGKGWVSFMVGWKL